MVTKILILIGACACILLFSACPDNCDQTDYEFQLYIDYSPIKDTFQIGDTLRVKSSFEDELLDPSLNVFRKTVDFNFYSKLNIRIVMDGERIPVDINTNQVVNANIDFTIRNYSNNSGGILVEKHNYHNNNYDFEFDLILQKPGIYCINTYSDIGDFIGTSQQNFEDQCTGYKVYARYQVNNGDAYENNFDLIEGVPPFEQVQDFNFNMDGGFAFIVKE